MRLSQPQVIDLLSELHNVSDDRPTAVRGRVQSFQRLGFPKGTNTGRGIPATYGPLQVTHLLFAFELLQLGLAPERIVSLIKRDERALTRGLRDARHDIGRDLFAGPSRKAVFAVIDPSAVTIGAGDAATWQGDIEFLEFGARSKIEGRVFRTRRSAVINLSSMLERAAAISQRKGIAAITEWEDAMSSLSLVTHTRPRSDAEGNDPEA